MKRKFLSMVLCLALTLGLAAPALAADSAGVEPDGVEQVTFTLTKTLGGDAFPNTVSGVTANLFSIGNSNGTQTQIHIEFPELPKGTDFRLRLNGSDAQYLSNNSYTNYQLPGAEKGSLELNLVLSDNYSAEQDTVRYTGKVTTYLTDTAPTLAQMNTETKMNHVEYLSPYVNLYLPKGAESGKIAVKLVEHGTNKVVALSSSKTNVPNAQNTTRKDARYETVFSAYFYPQFQIRSVNANLSSLCPMEDGKKYDAQVFFGAAEEPNYTVENAIEASSKPVINNLYAPQQQPGSQKVIVNLNYQYDSIIDFTIAVKQGDTVLGTAAPDALRYTGIYGTSYSATADIALSAALESGKSYTVEAASTKEFVGPKSNTLSPYDQARSADSIYVADGTKAHALLYTTGYSNDTAYKAVLIDAGKNAELASYVTHCVDGVFDLEFRDQSGAVLALTPGGSYRFEVRARNSYSGDWDTYGNNQYYRPQSHNTYTELYGYCGFRSSLVWGGIGVPKGTVDPIADKDKLSVQIVGLDGKTYAVTTTVEKDDYSGEAASNWSTYYTLTGTAPQDLPHGNYYFRALYDGVELKKLGSEENLFAADYVNAYRGAEISVSYYTSSTTGGYTDVCPGVFVYGLDNGAHKVEAKLYPTGQDGAPVTVALSKDAENTDRYDFTAAGVQAAKLDLSRRYSGLVLLDDKIVGTISDTYVCPDDLPNLETTYTAAVSQQPAHGTLAVSTASGKFGTAVYVLSTPEQGYELKPGSVKVNGKAIAGRAFVLTENATVTAEFQPVTVEKFAVEIYQYINNGTVTADKATAAAGETVTLTVTPNTNYKVDKLYYTDSNGQNEVIIDKSTKAFVMPDKKVSVRANFSYKSQYNITVDNNIQNGAITLSGGSNVYEEDIVNVTVTPNSGYRLKSLYYYQGYSANGEKIAITGRSFPMPGYSIYLTAEFEEGADKENTVVTVTQASGVYGDTLADPVKSASPTGANPIWTVTYAGRDGTAYQESANKPTEPGKYTVTAAYEDDIYIGSASADFVIDKATPTVEVTATAKYYDGTAATVSATNTGDGTGYTYIYATTQTGAYGTVAPTNAGLYWVKAKVIDTARYTSAESIPVSFMIFPKTLHNDLVTITGVDASYAATGEAITPEPIVKYNNITLNAGEDKDYTLSYEANTAVGNSAKVIITFRGNYLGNASVTFAIVDLPAQTVTFTSPTVDAKIYGDAGFTNAATSDGSGAISYKSSNANVATVDAGGQVTIIGAGTATITATAAAVPETSAPGTASYTLTVTPAALTVTGLAATNRAYDGTKNVTLTGGALDGILNSDDVTATMPTNGTILSADADNGKAVTIPTITLSGAKKGNYTVTQPQGVTVDITKAAAPVVAPVSKAYSCASAHVDETLNLAALLPADRGETTFAIDSVTDESTILDGDPTVSEGVLTFSIKTGEVEQTAAIIVGVTDMTNYENTTITVNITLVDKVEVTITGVSVTGKTYDGIAVALTGTPEAEDYTGEFEYVYSGVEGTVYGSADAPKNAGTYTLTVKVPEADTEFMGETEAMPFTIEKAALTIKPADKSIYTGDALPNAFELTYTGFVNGENKDALTITGDPEYALKNGENALENSNTAGAYTIAWTNKDGVVITADNYAVTKADGVLTISDRPSSGGGTGGGSTPSKPVTNPDGSTTITTKNPDGSTTAVTEGKDGGKVTETTTKSGTTITATVPADKNAAPTVSSTIKAETKDGAVKAEVPAKDVDALVKAATDSKAGTITIAPDVKSGTDAAIVTVTLPAEAAAKLGKAADVAVATPVGTVTLPAAALVALGAGKEAVSVTLEAKADATFSFELKAGDKALDAVKGGVKVSLPAEKATPGTVAVLVLPDGTEQVIRKSVAGADDVSALLDGSATVKLVDNSKSFTDVPAGNWAADAVAFASGHDLFQGVSGSDFAPGMTMNRGMLVTVLNRLENEAKGEATANFGDVDGSAYYADAVAWASENGIVTGTGAGFAPDAAISRESLAVMLYRYADALGYDTSAKADSVGSDVSSWATDAMSWAVGSGLLKGDGSGSLNPAASATRAETAIILQRFVEGLVK